jgi:hypothetical protein
MFCAALHLGHVTDRMPFGAAGAAGAAVVACRSQQNAQRHPPQVATV